MSPLQLDESNRNSRSSFEARLEPDIGRECAASSLATATPIPLASPVKECSLDGKLEALYRDESWPPSSFTGREYAREPLEACSPEWGDLEDSTDSPDAGSPVDKNCGAGDDTAHPVAEDRGDNPTNHVVVERDPSNYCAPLMLNMLKLVVASHPDGMSVTAAKLLMERQAGRIIPMEKFNLYLELSPRSEEQAAIDLGLFEAANSLLEEIVEDRELDADVYDEVGGGLLWAQVIPSNLRLRQSSGVVDAVLDSTIGKIN